MCGNLIVAVIPMVNHRMRTPYRIVALLLGAFFVLFGLAYVTSGSGSLKAPIAWILFGLLLVFAAVRGHLFGVFDEPVVQAQGETLEGTKQFNIISQRFIAGEISVDEAAGKIVALMDRLEPKHEAWALTFGSNYQETSEEDQRKFKVLMDRICRLLKEREIKQEPE